MPLFFLYVQLIAKINGIVVYQSIKGDTILEPIITIQEEYILPSLGKVYSEQFDPHIRLRSMTVADEMKRQGKTASPYKTMCEIIDSCILDRIPVSSYDMCIGDYQYLIHKLRTVTYGPDYEVSTICPHCGKSFNFTINLDDLDRKEYNSSEIENLLNVKLNNGDIIKLKMQTPRDLDEIDKGIKTFSKDSNEDFSLPLNIVTFIQSINGEELTFTEKFEYAKRMSMGDTLDLLDVATKLNESIGVNIEITTECTECKKAVNTYFRYSQEFFRPRTRR